MKSARPFYPADLHNDFLSFKAISVEMKHQTLDYIYFLPCSSYILKRDFRPLISYGAFLSQCVVIVLYPNISD
jgi:hypothetical protein